MLLTAESLDAARRELGALQTSAGGVFLLGALDSTRAFAILDAADLKAAEERFGPQLSGLGPHELDEWYASSQLAHLSDP